MKLFRSRFVLQTSSKMENRFLKFTSVSMLNSSSTSWFTDGSSYMVVICIFSRVVFWITKIREFFQNVGWMRMREGERENKLEKLESSLN